MGKTIVMVIGDDPQFIYLMQSYIRKSGCDMQLVSRNRPDLLSFIQKINPIMVLFDADCLWAGQENILKTVRASQITAHIPRVVCSWTEGESGSWGEIFEYKLSKPVIYYDFQQALAHVGYVQFDN